MITAYTLNSETWTPISTAGQSGSCWLAEDSPEGLDVRVFHSSTTPELSDFANAKRIERPKFNENNDGVQLAADDMNDIFYAITRSGAATIIADMI